MNEMLDSLTTAQRAAAVTDGRNLLVCAAAGSGKTYTLTCRVIRRLTDPVNPCDADRMLIATFTRAAAAQMKAGISRALAASDDPRAARQQVLLSTAHIGTIDSFCLWLVKQYGGALGLPAGIQIASQQRLQRLEEDVLNEFTSECFDSSDPDILLLADLLAQKGADRVTEAVFKLHEFCQALPSPEKWVEVQLNKYNGGYYAEALAADAAERFAALGRQYAALAEYASDAGFERDALYLDECAQICAGARNAANGGDPLAALPDSLPRARGERGDDPRLLYVREVRSDIKGRFDKTAQTVRAAVSRDSSPQLCAALCRLALRYGQRLEKEKLGREMFGYADISRFAARLLFTVEGDGQCLPTELATELSGHYDEIMLDEFQDINRLQYNIFKALSNGRNLFMVGDIKQSIYRFRHSSPEIFAEISDRCAPVESAQDNALISLNSNFRSDPSIIDAVNSVFGILMRRGGAGIEYGEGQRLNCHDPSKFTPAGDFELHYTHRPEDMSAVEADARFCAQRISELLGTDIYTAHGSRPALLSDFCILTHTNLYGAQIAEALNAVGVRSRAQGNSDFFERPEVSALLSALWAVDNPLNEIALLSALLSPIWGFTPDELGLLCGADKRKPLYNAVSDGASGQLPCARKCGRFIHDITQLRRYNAVLPPGELLDCLVEMTGFEAVAGAMGGDDAVENITRLIKYASDEGERGCTLTEFVYSVEAAIASSKSPEIASGATEDAVSVGTIHKSKGLEYPIVILAEHVNVRKIKRGGETPGFIAEPEAGIAALISAEDGQSVETAASAVVRRQRERKDVAEKLRLLYVAMTRAQHKLIVNVCCPQGVRQYLSRVATALGRDIPDSVYDNCDSFEDWLSAAALLHPDAQELRELAGADDLPTLGEGHMHITVGEPPRYAVYKNAQRQTVSQDVELRGRLARRMSYEYPNAELTRREVKYTVTGLAKDGGELEPAVPNFVAGVGGSTYGTELHRFMQMCDFNSELDARSQAQRLHAEGKLSGEALDLLNFKSVDRFFASGLLAQLKACDKILREFDFIAQLPLSSADPQAGAFGNEPVILQGCADCVGVRKDGLILVDYKTDALTGPEDFIGRYATQLRLYAECLEKIFARPVLRMVIYSLRLGMEIDIERNGGEKTD